jgi:hypothetical protein
MPTSRTWSSSSYRSTYYRGSRTSRSSTSYNTGWSSSSPKFNNVRNECQYRIGSYENIYSQCSGSGKTPFSPSTANKWVKYVNNGALVYKFNHAQFCRFFGRQLRAATPMFAFRHLKNKFGSGIKAVCRGKNNQWLVAASPNVSGRAFTSYDWD